MELQTVVSWLLLSNATLLERIEAVENENTMSLWYSTLDENIKILPMAPLLAFAPFFAVI